jgi:hypothetical protein
MKAETLKQTINPDIDILESTNIIRLEQEDDTIYINKSKLPELIKILQSFVVMLLLSVSSFAQTHTSLLTEIGTTDFRSQSYAGMIGFTNFQDDSFHAGLLYKNYGSANRIGARVNVNLNLNDLMFVFIQSDIFAGHTKQENSSFMENSAGLGFRLFKGLSAHLGYQMEDYNPITKIRSEDRPNVKISYKIRL